MNKQREFPRCPDCGGAVEVCSAKGKTREVVEDIYISLPRSLNLPTCTKCKELSLALEDCACINNSLEEVLSSKDCLLNIERMLKLSNLFSRLSVLADGLENAALDNNKLKIIKLTHNLIKELRILANKFDGDDVKYKLSLLIDSIWWTAKFDSIDNAYCISEILKCISEGNTSLNSLEDFLIANGFETTPVVKKVD